MKFNISKDWITNNAHKEEGQSIDTGIPPTFQPTPPTPAGAGTETPSGDVLLSRVRAEALDAELTALRLQSHRDKATIRELESAHNIRSDECEGLAGQLSEARRQAEADRATINTLNERIECDAQDNGTLMSDNTSLRAQLATADKDRERLDVLLEALNTDGPDPRFQLMATLAEKNKSLTREIIDQALQVPKNEIRN